MIRATLRLLSGYDCACELGHWKPSDCSNGLVIIQVVGFKVKI